MSDSMSPYGGADRTPYRTGGKQVYSMPGNFAVILPRFYMVSPITK